MDKDYQEYIETGLLGVYRPECAVLRKAEDGGVETFFRDTKHILKDDGFIQERVMLNGGKRFLVSSVFQNAPTATPTDKLLSLINAELERESHSAGIFQ